MKSENVLRVFLVALIVLLVCVSIDFGLVLASTRSSNEIANKAVLNEKMKSQVVGENDVEANYSESVKGYNDDFLNFNMRGVESKEFTPGLYSWLWDNLQSQ
jgi:hypothetical protein